MKAERNIATGMTEGEWAEHLWQQRNMSEEDKTVTTKYICTGSVRGQCQHLHRTLTGAVDCLRRDRRACKRQGGYSDRTIERTDLVPLTRDEFDEVQWRIDNENE